MTIKFPRTSSGQRITAPDGLQNTLFAGDETLAFVLCIEPGSYTGTEVQVLFSTGGLTAGSVNICYFGSGAPSPFNVSATFGSTSTYRSGPAGLMTDGGKYLCALMRQDSTLVWKICPILQSPPSDGSAVVTQVVPSFSMTTTTGYDGPAPLMLGSRNDSSTTRGFDNSIGRVFHLKGLLTDLEIARLAYGETILQLGKTPEFYAPMDDANDLRDLGTQPRTLTKTDSTTLLANGSAPGFGYTPPVPAAPVFTAAPVISGIPSVGNPVGYSGGTYTGYPAPTLTRQWTLDGVDIAGANGATYAPAAGSDGKALRLRLTATNENGSVSSTSDPATIQAAAPPDAYTVTDVRAGHVWQVSGSPLRASVPLAGSYAGASVPASAEAQIYGSDGATIVQAWAALTETSFANGAWSGKLAVPGGDDYRLAVRFRNASGSLLGTTATTTNLWGAGNVIAFGGSSSAAGWDNTGSFTTTPRVRKLSTANGGTWESASGASNGAIVLLANALVTRTGLPVGLLPSGASGTTLQDWVGNASSQFAKFANLVTIAGGKLAGAMFTAGSNDAAEAAVVSQQAHLDKMRLLIQKARDLTGQADLPILWGGFNRRLNAQMPYSDWVRTAETRLGDDPNVCHVQTVDLPLGSDGTHLTGTGYRITLERAIYQWPLISGQAYKRGPKVFSYTYSGNAVTVTMSHRNGDDFGPAENITGLTVTDASGTPALVSSVRVNSSQFRQTFDRPLVAPVVVKYLSGQAPEVGTQVFDNGATALPMTVETELEAVFSTVTLVSAEYSTAYAIEAVSLVSADYASAYAIEALALVSTDYGISYSIMEELAMSFVPSAARTLTVSPTSKVFTGGAFWNLTAPTKPRGPKDPNSVIDISLDWGPWLNDIGNPPIAQFAATLVGVTNIGAYAEGSLTTVFVGGGIGSEGRVTFKITTATTPALTDERTVFLDLAEQ